MTQATAAAGWGALLVAGVALGLTGAVDPWSRAAVHGGLALVLGGLARRRLREGPSWAAPLTALALVGAVSLLPLPMGIVRVLAPGSAAAWAGHGWAPLTASAIETAGALATLALVAGVAAVSGAARPTPERLARVLAWAGIVWVAVGALHMATGATSMFGVIPVRPGLGRLVAPLINPNHHGTVVMLVWPAALWVALRPGPAAVRLACLGVVAWSAALPGLVSGMGLLGALGVQVLSALLWALVARFGLGRGAALGGVAAAGVAAAGFGGARWIMALQPEFWALSVAPRLAQWGDTAALLRAHLWWGGGLGAYEAAYAPVRTARDFSRLAHAHADGLELLTEVGLVGAVVVAVGIARGPWPAWTSSAWTHPAGRVVALGLWGALAHAMVDFPLHVPGVLVAVVGTAAAWASSGAAPSDAPRGAGRWWGLAGLQVAAVALWLVQGSVEAAAARVAADGPEAASSAAWLARWAPWRVEPDLRALRRGAPEARTALAAQAVARFPADATVLRVAGDVARLAGDPALAEQRYAAAIARDPADFRPWAGRALVAGGRGEPAVAAAYMAEALRRWPRELVKEGRPLDWAWAMFPVGPWWVQALGDAGAHWSLRLAWIAADDGDWATALLASEQASRLRPAAHRYTGVHAIALARLGMVDAAWREADACVLERPDLVWGWLTVGELGAITDRPDRADEGYLRALLLGPDERRVRRLASRWAAACADCPDGLCADGPCATAPVGRAVDALTLRDAEDEQGCARHARTLRERGVPVPAGWCERPRRGAPAP